MAAEEVIASLEIKAQGYASLCVARDQLRGFLPASEHEVCTEMAELGAMTAPATPGMPALDAAILLVLQEIAIYMESIAEYMERRRSPVA